MIEQIQDREGWAEIARRYYEDGRVVWLIWGYICTIQSGWHISPSNIITWDGLGWDPWIIIDSLFG